MADIREKPNGKFLVRWRDAGKQRYRQFDTRPEAEAFKVEKEPAAVDKLIAEARRRGEYVDPFGELDRWGRPVGASLDAAEEKWSFGAYAIRVITADRDLTDSTRARYRTLLRLYVLDTALGRADVRYLTPEVLTDWWNEDERHEWAVQVVSKVLRRAMVAGDRPDNPMQRVPEIKRPRRKSGEIEPLDSPTIERLAEEAAARPTRFTGDVADMVRQRDRIAILLMGYAGLRGGEVGGLRRQDVRRTRGRCQLTIRQQVLRTNGEVYVTQLKSAAGRRTVDIACSLMDEIDAFVERFGTAPDGRLLRGPNGEMRNSTNWNHVVMVTGKRLGMDVNAHQLRHSAVSLLILELNADPRTVQRWAGHASVTLTLQTYGHLFSHGGQELAEGMERLREQHRNTR